MVSTQKGLKAPTEVLVRIVKILPKSMFVIGPNGEEVNIGKSVISDNDAPFIEGDDVTIRIPRWKARELK